MVILKLFLYLKAPKQGARPTPYGSSKLIIEQMLEGFGNSGPSKNIAQLRYFNSVAAHESGMIGDDPAVYPII